MVSANFPKMTSFLVGRRRWLDRKLANKIRIYEISIYITGTFSLIIWSM